MKGFPYINCQLVKGFLGMLHGVCCIFLEKTAENLGTFYAKDPPLEFLGIRCGISTPNRCVIDVYIYIWMYIICISLLIYCYIYMYYLHLEPKMTLVLIEVWAFFWRVEAQK